MLTHARYPIAAAAVTDGVDFSYLQSFSSGARDSPPGRRSTNTGGSWGPPFGKQLDTWRERAPGFKLDCVTTPPRLEAIGLARPGDPNPAGLAASRSSGHKVGDYPYGVGTYPDRYCLA
jgi:hypothetical protein